MRAYLQSSDSEKLILRLSSNSGVAGIAFLIIGVFMLLPGASVGFAAYSTYDYELLVIAVFLLVIGVGFLAVGQMMRATAKVDPRMLEVHIREGYLAFRNAQNQVQFQLPLAEVAGARRTSRKHRTNKRGSNPQVYQEVWLDMVDGSQVCVSSHLAIHSPSTDAAFEALNTALAHANRTPHTTPPPQNLPANYRLVPEAGGALRIEWQNRFSGVILVVASMLGLLGLGFGLLTAAGMMGWWQGAQIMLAFGVFVGLFMWMGIRMRTRTNVLRIAPQLVTFFYSRRSQPVGKTKEVPSEAFSGFFLSIQGTAGDAKLVMARTENVATIRSFYRGEDVTNLFNWRELFQMIRASQMLPIPASRKIEMLHVWWAATLAARAVGVIGAVLPTDPAPGFDTQAIDI